MYAKERKVGISVWIEANDMKLFPANWGNIWFYKHSLKADFGNQDK